MLILISRMEGFDKSLEEAAMDLGGKFPDDILESYLPYCFAGL
ncbi:MAG: hypothetical protein CM1200mP30_26740 [Pseudomonadota bacterium]|nr:MAG: hypothetical protein CM1200mP30_26740 [Pseudomonadota bacterium]